SAASIACATSAAPPLCQTARTWRWSCGMTTSAVRPVATPRPPMRGVISTTSLDILASWARKALRSGLPGAYARMGSLRGGGTETIAFGMSNAIVSVPPPRNEPILAYAPGSPERKALRAQLAKMSSDVVEITPRIGGRGVATGRTAEVVMPHDHRHVLAVWHKGGAAEVAHAIDAALVAHREWSRMAWPGRATIFLRGGDPLAGPYRMLLNAATMLGQSKT